MARLLPNIRAALRRAGGIQDGATRKAVDGLEQWAGELVQQLAQVDTASVSGTILPIAESDVTNLVTDLAAKTPTSRTLTGTAPIRIDGGASGDLTANRTISITTYAGSAAGAVPAGAGSTTKYLREDGAWATIRSYLSNVFWQGFGSHGSLHFDGTSVVAGITPAANNRYPQNGTRTYVMTEDIDATDITVDSGVSLICQNYRIFWTGTFTNNGLVGNPGCAAVGASGGAAITTGFYPQGLAGGAGTSNANGSGNAGAASTSVPRIWATLAAGDATGTGQGGKGGLGANGGALTVTGATNGTFILLHLIQGRVGPAFAQALSFGSGGGGGGISGYTTGSAAAGGGGAGGGCCFISGNILAGSGTFTCAGGAGAVGNHGSTSATCGGGGGGGGGVLGLVYNTNTGTCTTTAAGGAGGLTDTAGSNGAGGTVVVASGDGT